MARSYSIVDYKVQEAEYFLNELSRLGAEFRFGPVQFCASAFASAARSITFAMQASLKGSDGFELWYKTKQQQLRENSLAKFFHDFRTVTQHIGETVVGGGAASDGGVIYFFVSSPDLPIVPDEDVVSACETYFVTVLRIVYESYIEFGTLIDGQQYYTARNFHLLGKSIEDAEEELGFPRGYTDIGDANSGPYRWQQIRSQADGCEIERQFMRWLGLSLPREQIPPPYPGRR